MNDQLSRLSDLAGRLACVAAVLGPTATGKGMTMRCRRTRADGDSAWATGAPASAEDRLLPAPANHSDHLHHAGRSRTRGDTMSYTTPDAGDGNPIERHHEDHGSGQRPRGYQPRHRTKSLLSRSRDARRLALAVGRVVVREGLVAATAPARALRRVGPRIGSAALASEQVGATDVGFDYEA